MSQDSNYRQQYSVLEIEPDCTWKELRAAYRQAVKTWHPDRFTDEAKKEEAEEKIKAINIAFNILSDYFKARGVLPLSSSARVSNTADTASEPAPSTARPRATDEDLGGWADIPATTSNRIFTFPRVMLLVIVCGLSYAGWSALTENDQRATGDRYSTVTSPKNLAPKVAKATKSKKYFSIGSTIGEVYDAQGKPDRTEGDTWHYGNSTVVFKNGKVLKWSESALNPLNTTTVAVANGVRTFTYGSTKQEVLAAMGTPTHTTKEEWLYGVSRVNFKDGRVVSWYSSPLDPLTAAREK